MALATTIPGPGNAPSTNQVEPLPARPALRVRERGLRSPAVVTGHDPTIVFPVALVKQLSDADLEAALAHEVAHVYLRQPVNCFSSETVRAFSAVNNSGGWPASGFKPW